MTTTTAIADIAPPRRSIRTRAVRASAWLLVGYGGRQALRMTSSIVLAWLLFPEAFGLIALVTVCLQGLEMFSDIGIGPSIIHNKRGMEPAFLNTAWTMQVIRGCVLWLSACALAVPAAALFARNDPAAWQLVELLPVAALTAVIAGFNSTNYFTLSRDLNYSRLVWLDLSSKLVSMSVMIGWALVHPSVWALVAGSLTSTAYRMVLSHLWLPGPRNWFAWESASARSLISFGKWIFLSTIVTFFAMQADKLLLGNLVTMDLLGIYAIAVMLAGLPKEVVGRLTRTVLFPALAERSRRNNDDLAAKVHAARRLMLSVGCFALLGVVLLAPPFFTMFYDERYHSAGWMAQFASAAAWISLLGSTSTAALLAVGRTRPLAGSNIADLGITVTACIGGYFLFDLPGFIVGYAAGKLAALVVINVAMHRAQLPVTSQDAAWTALAGVLAIATLLLAAMVSETVDEQYAQLAHAAVSALVLMAFGAAVLREALPLLLNR